MSSKKRISSSWPGERELAVIGHIGVDHGQAARFAMRGKLDLAQAVIRDGLQPPHHEVPLIHPEIGKDVQPAAIAEQEIVDGGRRRTVDEETSIQTRVEVIFTGNLGGLLGVAGNARASRASM